MKILGTGLTGLVGSRIVDLLQDSFEFENLSRSTGFDITSKKEVSDKISSSSAQVVFHFAAKADVDGCEKDKALQEDGEAWEINVAATQYLVDACNATGKKIVYISTDFVFDGEKETYTEEDIPNPLNWYGMTKYEGEKYIQSHGKDWIIARIAYPYRSDFPKNDFCRAMLKRLKEQQPINAVTDHLMTPTYIDDIAQALKVIVESDATGIYHVVGSSHISPFDAAQTIAHMWDLDTSFIHATTRSEYFQGKAPRPFRLALENDKIEKLGATMVPFVDGLTLLKKGEKSQ